MTHEAPSKLSVIVLTHNRKKTLEQCLNKIYSAKGDLPEVIVVDNGSNDGTEEMLKNLFSHVKTVYLKQNLGVSGGRNQGILLVTGEIIIFLDDDCFVTPDFFEILAKIFCLKTSPDIVACKILDANSSAITCWSYYPPVSKFSNKNFKTHVFSGGACAIKKNVFDTIGLFDDTFLYGGEETDFALRALNHNFEIIYDPNAVIYHGGEARSNMINPRAKEHLHHIIYFFFKNLPILIAVKYTFRAMASNWSIAKNYGLFTFIKIVFKATYDISRDHHRRCPINSTTIHQLKKLEKFRPSIWSRIKK
jgi:GT2 family glycosyltransferase